MHFLIHIFVHVNEMALPFMVFEFCHFQLISGTEISLVKVLFNS